ncbi:MAG: gliding motility protein GldN [Flavobacteriaceae bacterium]|jgi:gliding motility associated protien GldN|nr:gliding motility protein GldN [Flavobacteriaceae bacterium]
MRSLPILLLFYFLIPFKLEAQANLLNARVPQDVGKLNEQQIKSNNEEPLKYGFVDDRDVLWSKTVWEIIDLDERVNFPYYYPTETDNLGLDRLSLWDVLKNAITSGEIKEVYDDPYFRTKLLYEDINFTYSDTTDFAKERFEQTGVWDKTLINDYKLSAKYVRQYKIKGTWYVDKRLGELKYRLLGICPVAIQPSNLSKFISDPDTNDTPVDLFWVWFPDARTILNRQKVFNTRNSSQPVTFDHMLNSRRFNSLIYKEENIYEDREINKYIQKDALKSLLESERIKSVIRDYEQDMWNN